MSRMLICCVFIVSLPVLILGMKSNSIIDQNSKVSNVINDLPIMFTENMGQWEQSVLYRADARGAILFLTQTGVSFQFIRPLNDETVDVILEENRDKSFETTLIQSNFVGANTNPTFAGVDKLSHYNNYFIGNNSNEWYTDVPNYSAVVIQDVYNGIDVKYYSKDNKVEYDFIVSPDADHSQINIRYEGASSVAVDAEGRLIIDTDWGTVIEEKPIIYQEINNKRQYITGEFLYRDDFTFGFTFTENYDKNLPIVIDPVLNFSSFFGGTGDEYCLDLEIDDNDNSYIIGYTNSTDLPTQNPYQAVYSDNFDIFISKFDNTGGSLLYSTYIGGASTDNGFCVAVDSAGYAYLTGKTASTDFPTQNAFQSVYGGGTSDIFLAKVGLSGNVLEYSTYLGGSLDEDCWDIDVDDRSCAYVTGRTKSTNFPILNAYQATYNGGVYDGIVAKFDSAGNTLAYSTYLGGTEWDFLNEIAVDNNGNATVIGGTASTLSYPLKSAYQTTFGGGAYDVCLTMLGATGDTLVYSTFLGGNGYDVGFGVDVDQGGNTYIIGNTGSTNYPTLNAFQDTFRGGTYDIFVTKLSNFGTSLAYSTFLGGSGTYDVGNNIKEYNGKAYITGGTTSSNFPMSDPYQYPLGGGADAVIAIFDTTGSALEFSTFLGGTGSDYVNGIDINEVGDIFLAGYTNSLNFPVQNAYQDSLNIDTTTSGTIDAFLTRFNINPLSIEDNNQEVLPNAFVLSQNYPNPFNPTTDIDFSIPYRSNVLIEVFNVLGQAVRILHDGELPAGSYTVQWDGKNDSGQSVSSGIYLYKLVANDYSKSRKMILLK